MKVEVGKVTIFLLMFPFFKVIIESGILEIPSDAEKMILLRRTEPMGFERGNKNVFKGYRN